MKFGQKWRVEKILLHLKRPWKKQAAKRAMIATISPHFDHRDPLPLRSPATRSKDDR